MSPDPLLIRIVVLVVTLSWSVALFVSLYTHEYDGLIYCSPPMGLVVGYVTGVRILRKNGNGSE